MTARAGAPLMIILSASDIDDDVLDYTVSVPPSYGTLSGTPPELTYTPNAGYRGEDSFAFVVSDGALEDEGEISILVVAVVTPLNDTGITGCADEVATALDCNAMTSHPGQDGMLGRDAMADELAKIGGGHAGFDFSRVCHSGQRAGQGSCPEAPILGSGQDDWGCTRDNVTGLTWEVKVDDGNHLRHRSHHYTWFDPSVTAAHQGTQNAGRCVGSDCDTHGYVRAVNAAGLCGASDWRLPSPTELNGIVANDRTRRSIDSDYFPQTDNAMFWSNTHNVTPAGFPWTVSFWGGTVGTTPSDGIGVRARLVRGGMLGDETGNVRYTDHGDGTVTDTHTGLTWAKCARGQSWLADDPDTCGGFPQLHSWESALQEALDANADGGYLGHTDWRLPNKNELVSLVDKGMHAPAIDTDVFPVWGPSLQHWTSSPAAANARTWFVDFGAGSSMNTDRDRRYRVRLVRGGQ